MSSPAGVGYGFEDVDSIGCGCSPMCGVVSEVQLVVKADAQEPGVGFCGCDDGFTVQGEDQVFGTNGFGLGQDSKLCFDVGQIEAPGVEPFRELV